jgi:hypothetical protein
VLSLLAIPMAPAPVRSQFEVMVRHLYDRLLNNEVFGEDAATRLAQIAYAIALPGVLIALFLFPAYHGLPPHPLERSFWSQACDHLFFVTYAFVIMGSAIIFQWEMLFPDPLDVSVMATLPIELPRLLAGRIAAMTIFLALVHLGTSGLGCLFLPAVADQRCGYVRQLFAHAMAVTMSGASIVAALIVLQAMLVCLPRGRVAEMMRSLARILSLTMLLTVLFLFPLTAHYLKPLLDSGAAPLAARCFPPFWFLGVYEWLMWGGRAPFLFHQLAGTGLLATAGLIALAAAIYPLGYVRRVRQLVEGGSLEKAGSRSGSLQAVMHRILLRSPQTRATAHFAAQTLRRLERLHLYLAMYAGVGVALVLSGVLALRTNGSAVALVFSVDGLRVALPIVVFWTVAGMKTALLSPLGRRGSWIFHVIGGSPDPAQLRGARLLTTCTATVATLLAVGALDAAAPHGALGPRLLATQLLFACSLPLILSQLFFAGVRTVPFTGADRISTRELPLAFVRYFVTFPAFALSIAAAEIWTEVSVAHLVGGALLLLASYLLASEFRVWRATMPPLQEELTLMGFSAE